MSGFVEMWKHNDVFSLKLQSEVKTSSGLIKADSG